MSVVVFNKGKISSKSPYGGAYDGSKDMGDLNNWRILTADANELLENNYNLLSSRSTTLYHTYAPVRGAINKQIDYGIGPGLVFRSQPDYRRLGISKESASDWGKEFQVLVDYYFRKFNFYEKQNVLGRSALTNGDSFLYFEREKDVLTDIIDIPNTQFSNDYSAGDYTLGIKHDEWLRRKAIMKCDSKTVPFRDEAGDQVLIQFYIKELARQLRGYPLAYSIINLARNDDTHTDAITHRAVMESILIGSFESNGTDFQKQTKSLAEANKKKKGDSRPNLLEKISNAANLGAGSVLTTNVGEKMNFTDLKTPSTTFGMFKEWIWNYVAAATGTPPEVMMAKYSTSFTAHKGALNDFIKSYMNKRKVFERTVLNIVIDEIAKDAISQGFISAPGYFTNPMIKDAYLKGLYLGPVPGHINPLVEVKAQELEAKSGFKLRSDVTAQNGYEWDSFINEWTKEQIEFTRAPQEHQAEAVFNAEQEKSNNSGEDK